MNTLTMIFSPTSAVPTCSYDYEVDATSKSSDPSRTPVSRLDSAKKLRSSGSHWNTSPPGSSGY